MIDHVVRRGLEHASTLDFIKRAAQDGPKIEIPGWGVFLLVTTVFVITVFLCLVDYSLKDVVATLAMVETPSAAITVSSTQAEAGSKSVKEGLLETGPTITLVHQKPITSGIRGTLRHLVSLAGAWARVRGVLCFYLYNVAFAFIHNILTHILPRFPGQPIVVAAMAGAALANLHAAWTFKVISMPTDQWFHKRMPRMEGWKVLAFPAAVATAMPYISLYIVQGFGILFGLHRLNQVDVTQFSGAEWAWLITRFVVMFVIVFACSIFICLPAMVTQIRVEASILPDDQDTIVPFDRTFNGKVVAKILGGTGCIGFLDAWRSFNWEARVRLIKVYVKAFFIVTGLFVVLAHVLAFEAWAIMGPAFSKALQGHRVQ
ncbi:hypothetical protein K505DRAFT_263505 [Melanomma pulvis-pyrius CBS 109.77]|uniref:Ubiquitin carrier protein n=1 Tax=Melanomma pulvis-pyrius CBS 109.77 TaxID=1314802 RepID=A0A6A6XW67_9PLEO|nr:hypothetical protein K505DRAFT_263505 [Melanomma pulvis-pyrius CBS 109.77]